MDKITSNLTNSRFIPYDRDEMTLLEMLGKVITTTNDLIDTLENKTDLYGDHKGSWQGLNKPTLSVEGAFATVEQNKQRLDNMKVYNVLEYGAKGDGVTDDYQAFQDCINDLLLNSPVGGVIHIPSGVYVLSKPLNTYTNKCFNFVGQENQDNYYGNRNAGSQNIYFIGNGMDNTIIKVMGSYAFKPYFDNHKAFYRMTLSGIRFVGNDRMNSLIDTYKFNATIRDFICNDCSFVNFDSAIYYSRYDQGLLSEHARMIFNECYFSENNIGLEVSGDDTQCISCRMEYNYKFGVKIIGGHRMVFRDCKIQYNGVQGDITTCQIHISGTMDNITFDCCYLEPRDSINSSGNTGMSIIQFGTNEFATSYIYNINILNSYVNGYGCECFLKCTGSMTIKALTIKNNTIRLFKLNSANELLQIPSTILVDGLYCENRYEDIQNNSGTQVAYEHNFKISSSNNIKKNNGYDTLPKVTTPFIDTLGGTLNVIMGSVKSDGGQVYFGGNWFTVTKQATGTYLITLKYTNVGTSGGNNVLFPCVPTVSGGLGYACTEAVSSSSFKVKTLNTANTLTDMAFNFVCMISRQ